jgi:effector-binding domain-containing protein
MWRHMEENGLACTMPVWEIYIDDPGDTDPASLRTEIYRAIG